MRIFILLALLFSWVWGPSALACSAFFDASTGQVGKNFDMGSGHGLLIVNKSGVGKRGWTREQPAQWMSLFGSVTFNWVSRELPQGGINERGLIVEALWLDGAQYPPASSHSAVSVNELQWIQYQLDTSGTVADVIASLEHVWVQPMIAPLHYFICDASGACLVLEPRAEGWVRKTASGLPIAALTNSGYDETFQGVAPGGELRCGVSENYQSQERFRRLACGLRSGMSGFDLLASVAGRPGFGGARDVDQTQWSIVYDPLSKLVSWKTHPELRIHSISWKDVSFSCAKPTQVIDLHASDAGDVTSGLRDYQDTDNLRILRATSDSFAHLPPQAIEGIQKALASLPCLRP